MNIHRRVKVGCEISIHHYRNVFKNETFPVQDIEKLQGNVYKNGIKDNAMLE